MIARRIFCRETAWAGLGDRGVIDKGFPGPDAFLCTGLGLNWARRRYGRTRLRVGRPLAGMSLATRLLAFSRWEGNGAAIVPTKKDAAFIPGRVQGWRRSIE